MKKVFFLITLACVSIAKADTPGKRAMFDSKISIKNTSRLGGYNFYWSVETDSAIIFNHDSSFIIPGSGGRPLNAALWAVDKKTNASTDTIFFSNFYDPDYIITIDTVTSENKLLYSKNTTANSNAGGDLRGEGAGETNSGRPSRTLLFSGISLAALVILIGLFIRRKNAKNA